MTAKELRPESSRKMVYVSVGLHRELKILAASLECSMGKTIRGLLERGQDQLELDWRVDR